MVCALFRLPRWWRRFMTPEPVMPYQEGFRYFLDAAELQKKWARAFFATRMG